MRWFWGLLIAAVLAAAVLMVIPRGQPKAPVADPAPAPTVSPARPAEPPRATGPAVPSPAADAVSANTNATVPPKPPAAGGSAVRPVEPTRSAAETSPKPVDPAAAAKAAAPVAEAPEATTMPTGGVPSGAKPAAPSAGRGWAAAGLVGPPRPEEVEAMAMQSGLDAALGLAEPGAEGAGVGAGREPKAAEPKPAASAEAGAKAKLTARDDGTTLVDDRFVLKGAGTHEDPYMISWEWLVSAQETYQPRLGRKNIPDRLKMLDGKWVRIAGYIAFPIMAQSQDEMLMMLNQWDGCCIGVPPTPYDAIEVKLKAAAKGDDRLRVSGSITGILRVDPYLVKDWLVSLYLMDDAELKADTGGAKRQATPSQGHAPPQ